MLSSPGSPGVGSITSDHLYQDADDFFSSCSSSLVRTLVVQGWGEGNTTQAQISYMPEGSYDPIFYFPVPVLLSCQGAVVPLNVSFLLIGAVPPEVLNILSTGLQKEEWEAITVFSVREQGQVNAELGLQVKSFLHQVSAFAAR